MRVGVARMKKPELAERYVLFNKTDILMTPDDSIFVIHWPRDSLLFTKR